MLLWLPQPLTMSTTCTQGQRAAGAKRGTAGRQRKSAQQVCASKQEGHKHVAALGKKAGSARARSRCGQASKGVVGPDQLESATAWTAAFCKKPRNPLLGHLQEQALHTQPGVLEPHACFTKGTQLWGREQRASMGMVHA